MLRRCSIEQTVARVGEYHETIAGGEMVRAFVPANLPPEPPIDVLSLLEPFARAQSAIGRLDGITTLLPDDDLFLYMYVRKEAVLSSQIEGTQSTLNDPLRFESDAASGQLIDDTREVSHYVDAMLYGLEHKAGLAVFRSLGSQVIFHTCFNRFTVWSHFGVFGLQTVF